MKKFILEIVGIFLLASAGFAAAQSPTVETVPFNGDDIRRLMSMAAEKHIIHFGKPQFVRVEFDLKNGKTVFSDTIPATPQVTLLTYFPQSGGGGILRCFVLQDSTKDQPGDYEGVISFEGVGSNFTKRGFEDGVYTVRYGTTEEERDKNPALKLRLLTSDQKP